MASSSESPWSDVHLSVEDKVKAHSIVLCEASPFLRASLASEMQEGRTHVIPVPGASVKSVNMLLDIVYMGRNPEPLASTLSSCHKTSWSKGDRAEGNFRGRGTWWPCSVTWVYQNGVCDVTYDAEEGSSPYYEKRVHPRRLQVLGSFQNTQAEISEHFHTQLAALDIAHRWQIGYAAALLEQSLAEELQCLVNEPRYAATFCDSTFKDIFEMLSEAAELKDLPKLAIACRRAREANVSQEPSCSWLVSAQ